MFLKSPLDSVPSLSALHAVLSTQLVTVTFSVERRYKVVVNGVWFYASKQQVMDLVSGKQKACTFHTIKDEQ